MATNVTREECCKSKPAGEKYYSLDDEPSFESAQEKLKWRYVQQHKCIMACQGKSGCLEALLEVKNLDLTFSAHN